MQFLARKCILGQQCEFGVKSEQFPDFPDVAPSEACFGGGWRRNAFLTRSTTVVTRGRGVAPKCSPALRPGSIWVPNMHFGPRSAVLVQKCIVGPKVQFWPTNAFWAQNVILD